MRFLRDVESSEEYDIVVHSDEEEIAVKSILEERIKSWAEGHPAIEVYIRFVVLFGEHTSETKMKSVTDDNVIDIVKPMIDKTFKVKAEDMIVHNGTVDHAIMLVDIEHNDNIFDEEVATDNYRYEMLWIGEFSNFVRLGITQSKNTYVEMFWARNMKERETLLNELGELAKIKSIEIGNVAYDCVTISVNEYDEELESWKPSGNIASIVQSAFM